MLWIEAILLGGNFGEGVHFLVNTTLIHIDAHAVAMREVTLRADLAGSVCIGINRPQKVCTVAKCIAGEDGVHFLFVVIRDHPAAKRALSVLRMLKELCGSLTVEKCLRSAGLVIG